MLQQAGDPAAEAAKYIDAEKEVPDAETALAGARDILAETVSDSAEVRKELRALLNREGVLRSKAAKEEDSVYSMYYDFREPVRSIAAHRILAVNRGEREEFLKVSLEAPEEKARDVIRKAGFDGAFTFQYSKRTGTPAALMEQLPREFVQEQFDRVLKCVQDTAKERAGRFTGRIMEVLVEGVNEKDPAMLTGRISQNHVVHFPGEGQKPGEFIEVSLDECHGFYYTGHVVKPTGKSC